MSSKSAATAAAPAVDNVVGAPANADIDRDTPQPAIHVEERRLSLNDFLKTVVKINGSDLHLQSMSAPMIRVDGRARFLDCPPPDDKAMKEYVDTIMKAQGEEADRRHTLGRNDGNGLRSTAALFGRTNA